MKSFIILAIAFFSLNTYADIALDCYNGASEISLSSVYDTDGNQGLILWFDSLDGSQQDFISDSLTGDERDFYAVFESQESTAQQGVITHSKLLIVKGSEAILAMDGNTYHYFCL